MIRTTATAQCFSLLRLFPSLSSPPLSLPLSRRFCFYAPDSATDSSPPSSWDDRAACYAITNYCTLADTPSIFQLWHVWRKILASHPFSLYSDRVSGSPEFIDFKDLVDKLGPGIGNFTDEADFMDVVCLPSTKTSCGHFQRKCFSVEALLIYALQALEPAWITSMQIEAGRRAMTRYAGRDGKLWVRIFPDKPVTTRPAETRMGKGKGSPVYWVAVVKPGRILYEVSGVTEQIAREAISIAASKMPIRTQFLISS